MLERTPTDFFPCELFLPYLGLHNAQFFDVQLQVFFGYFEN
jgi:hypothetical protein